MDLTIYPGKLRGQLNIIPSKSQAHRALICAAFADRDTELLCPEGNRDMEATARCLEALGADIEKTSQGWIVHPVQKLPQAADLPCEESGSTLRFLLPVAGALGVDTTFHLEGRLPDRPLSPLWEELERMGCQLSRPTKSTVRIVGRLRPGEFKIRGDVSSQFISGLLFAAALIPGNSRITLLGEVQSRPYITMTRDTMERFGRSTEDLTVSGGRPYVSPGTFRVEGDWSSAAFFLAANALGSQVEILNLNENSCQGDRAVRSLLETQPEQICAADIPDLVPILAVAASFRQGAVFTKTGRLRLKESDRVETTLALIRSLGGRAETRGETLQVYGTGLRGGTVDARGDHRIAMAAAIAATGCREPVTILGAQCAAKSYPRFFEEFSALGGHYEQHVR